MKKYRLFFDSCGSDLNLILLDKNDRPAATFSTPTRNNLTDIAIEHVASFLRQNKVAPEQIERFYLTIGPGSFTGVRVGCVVGKTWCALNEDCELHVISTLRLQLPCPNGISALDARGDKVFCAMYQNNVGTPRLMGRDEFRALCKDNLDLPLYEDFANVSVRDCLLANLDNFRKVDSPQELVPLYLKDPI